MGEYMAQITPEMVKTVEKLTHTNFDGATPEEIMQFSEYNRLMALHDADFQQRTETRRQESEERRALMREQSSSAINALDALADLARAKLKAVEDGR